MVNAHPKALRQRVVDAYENGEGTQRELCERFHLSMGAVNAWIQQSRITGSVEPPAGKGGNVSGITQEDLEAILAEKPDLTQAEIAEKLQEKDIVCSRSGVNRAMARFGLTRKKKAAMIPRETNTNLNAEPSAKGSNVSPTRKSSSSMKPESGVI